MGGFNGWYESIQRAEIESFKAGCDMMLWPSKDYVKNMTEAVENGYVSMERLDDAVTRILEMKEKLGLFDKDNHAIKLSEEDFAFVLSISSFMASNSMSSLCL